MGKKRFFANHAKSSAMLVSLAVHGILIAIAVTFVAVSVMPREEPAFEPKKVNRPKMPPKKLKVPVETKKKKPKPRLRKRIVTERKMTDIQMPEISGVAGGLGNMGGDGMGSLGFDLDMDLFGSNQAMGNELVGTFYDLKQNKDGKPTGMNNGRYLSEIAAFTKGWNLSRFRNYFKAPQEKYATFFMIPDISADAAPKAYGVDNLVKPKHWVAYYTGNISAPETGHFRFCGTGDDILAVRIRNRVVLDAGTHRETGWKSDDDNNTKFPALMTRGHGTRPLYIGDWFKLTKGRPTEIEVLIGECPGGLFYSRLLIQQKGVEYKQAPFSSKGVTGTRPVLPVFKTQEIPKEMIEELRINPKIETLEGPLFSVVQE